MATKYYLGVSSDWSDTNNWNGGTIPVSGDDVVLEHASQDISTGLNQSAVLLDSLKIMQTYTGRLGTEASPLQIGAAIGGAELDIGENYDAQPANGSQRINLDLGANPWTIRVHDSSRASADPNRPPIRIICNDAATILRVLRGRVGLAVGDPTETATLATIECGQAGDAGSFAKVEVGGGVTVTTITKQSGQLIDRSTATVTTVTNDGGMYRKEGTGALTTVNAGGTCILSSSGTIGTCNGQPGGRVDFSKSREPRTVTNMNYDAGCSILFDPGVMTFTNGPDASEPVELSAIALPGSAAGSAFGATAGGR